MASTAMINTSNYNQKSFLIHKKPLMMLKDYLLDDFSSCSSSGFKSFPRRQCCTTVRLLLETDLNNKNSKPPQQPHLKRSNTASSTAISALQKASKAVINAVKLLPFPSSSSAKSSSSRNRKRVIRLPRSISRRLFKNRKADHRERDSGKIREWKLFGEFLEEIEKPSPDQISAAAAPTVANFTSDGDSSSSSTSINNSWTDSEFTGHSSCSESYSSQNGAGGGEKGSRSEKKVSGGAGEIVGGESITYSAENTKEWGNEEEKEQFSPVSVLDCPFQDDEEEEDINSPFERSLLSMEGSKQKFMAKMRKFETLTGIKPVNLEQQIEQLSEDEQNKSSASKHIKEEEEEDQAVEELLKLVMSRTSQNHHHLISNQSDSLLLLDFFKEKAIEKNGITSQFDEEIEVANKWINGEVEEMFLGWEVKDKRHVYVRDMERNNGSKWRNFDEEKQELVLELELELFTSLVDQVLLDFLS